MSLERLKNELAKLKPEHSEIINLLKLKHNEIYIITDEQITELKEEFNKVREFNNIHEGKFCTPHTRKSADFLYKNRSYH